MPADPAFLLDREFGPSPAEGELDGPVSVKDLINPRRRIATMRVLAEELAGTSDKSTREYRSARAAVGRWYPSRTARRRGVRPVQPSAESEQRLRAIQRKRGERVQRFRRGAQMKLRFQWYGDRNAEWRPDSPGAYVAIREWVMRRVVNLWAAGEPLEGWEELLREFLKQYGVPNPLDWLRDVEIVDLRLVPD